jgi:hypothetical protein
VSNFLFSYFEVGTMTSADILASADRIGVFTSTAQHCQASQPSPQRAIQICAALARHYNVIATRFLAFDRKSQACDGNWSPSYPEGVP